MRLAMAKIFCHKLKIQTATIILVQTPIGSHILLCVISTPNFMLS